ncbi:MAG: hypothetical protein Salg2KO_10400 [Salibacteraceae bacterium]
MTLTIAILLLLVAIALMLIEIFLVPGVGIPGIAGLALLVVSIYMAYQIDTMSGHYTLAAAAVVSVGLMLLAFRSKTWSKVSVVSEISGHVTYDTADLKKGDQGIAVSRLNPIGNIRVGDRHFEARSKGEFIDDHTPIEIVNIEGNKITVTPVKNT